MHHTLTQTLTWLAKNVNVSLGGDHFILRRGAGAGKFGQDGKFIFRYINARIFIFIRNKILKKSTDRPENTNVIEDVEILLPVNFRWIPFSGFRWKVEFVSAHEIPGRLFSFSWSVRKQKLGRGHWDLASCQVSLNSVQQFKIENVSADQRPGRPSCFSNRPENTNLVEDVEILFPVKFPWNPFGSFREVENVSANQRSGRPFCCLIHQKHKLGRWR